MVIKHKMAVYTKISQKELEEFLNDFSIGRLENIQDILEGVENSNFLLKTEKGRYILTLYERRTSKEDLPFYLNLMTFLKKRGINCPSPIKNNQRASSSILSNKTAAIFTFLEGKSLEKKRVSSNHTKEVGRILAKLHRETKNFKEFKKNEFGINSWRILFEKTRPHLTHWAKNTLDVIEKELIYLEKHWPQPSPTLPIGIIHADLFMDNVLFEAEKISGIIDFYFSCTDYLVYDLAICLNAWCFDNQNLFNEKLASALIEGYNEIKPLTKDEKDFLLLFSRGAAMRFFLTRLQDWFLMTDNCLVTKKDPNVFFKQLCFFRQKAAIKL